MTIADTINLGPLVLVGTQHGPCIDVTVAGCDGHLCLSVAEWHSLRALVDVLAAADRRHAEDERALRGAEAVLDTAIRLHDQLGEMLERVVGGDGASMERLQRLIAQANAAADGMAADYSEIKALRQQLASVTAERDALKQERDELRAERDAARAELAGAQGEILGLRVSAGFFERRADVLEAAAKRKLTRAEQDCLAGCCPFCGVTVGEYVQEATKRIEHERDHLRSDLAAAHTAADAMAARLTQLQPIVSVLGDWDWPGIVEDGCTNEQALESAAKALAYVAREQAKE